MGNLRKFTLARDREKEEPVSNLAIIGYSLPQIGLFLILCCFWIDPIAIWVTIELWWLVLIILISLLITFSRAMRKGGVLKKTVLTLTAANLCVLLLTICT
jgi:hypothetical protein